MVTEDALLSQLQEDIANNDLVLPTLPEVALRVRDAVEDDNTSAGQIADIVATDASLSARLLRVANSPLYRARNPIDNLQTAIARMGYAVVRNLITSLVMQQMFQATTEGLDQRLRQLWEHNVQVAAISRVLAARTPGLQKDQAMLGGLIHDIGILPILVRAEDMPELAENDELLDRLIDKLHPILGAQILTSWDFPESLIAVAAGHEDLQREHEGPADYVDVVTVANLQGYIGTSHPVSRLDWSSVPAFAKLGIEPDINVVEIEDHQEELEEIEHILITAPN
ncbi:MAG: HDOD domain-containing protein [Gammaproteobacteria bacterium]